MGCTCNNVSSDIYLSCARVNPFFTEDQVAPYANRVGAQGGIGNWVYCYVVACLRANRIIYWKQVPGDCTSSRSAGYQPNTDQIGGATAATLASADPEPISATILAAAGTVFNIFGAAHQAAVVNEETTLCQAEIDYNSFASAAEAALANGNTDPQSANVVLQQVVQRVQSNVASVAKPINTPNAGTGVDRALAALALFNREVVYPSIVAPVLPGVSSAVSQIPGVSIVQNAIAALPGVSSIPGGSSTVILVILAFLGWKLLSSPRSVAA